MPTKKIVSILVGVLVIAVIGGGIYMSNSQTEKITPATNNITVSKESMNKAGSTSLEKEEDMDVPMMKKETSMQ